MLFPGGPLPLRVFEPRYLDMISRCMKDDVPFGVLLIRDGAETGPATTHDVGTLARVIDWYQGSDGILGVTAVGEQRFRLLTVERQHDGLNIGEVSLLPNIEGVPLSAGHQAAVRMPPGWSTGWPRSCRSASSASRNTSSVTTCWPVSTTLKP